MRVSQPVVDRPVLWRQAFRPGWKLRENQAPAQGIEYRRFEMPLEEVLRTAHFFEKWRVWKALVDAQRERVLGLTAFGAGWRRYIRRQDCQIEDLYWSCTTRY